MGLIVFLIAGETCRSRLLTFRHEILVEGVSWFGKEFPGMISWRCSFPPQRWTLKNIIKYCRTVCHLLFSQPPTKSTHYFMIIPQYTQAKLQRNGCTFIELTVLAALFTRPKSDRKCLGDSCSRILCWKASIWVNSIFKDGKINMYGQTEFYKFFRGDYFNWFNHLTLQTQILGKRQNS